MTIQDIVKANKRGGRHFFDADTMRFFRSKVVDEVFEGPGGIYFVTSEQFVPSTGSPHPRRYTVRRFNPENGDIGTEGEFNKISRRAALKAAEKLASGSTS